MGTEGRGPLGGGKSGRGRGCRMRPCPCRVSDRAAKIRRRPPILADYQRFFASSVVQMLAVTPAVCERAAEVRVASIIKIKLPDALHLAAAIVHGCGLFLTNDDQLKKCGDITVEVLT
jgi:predicted nucleic acid-binding protein